jgi:hypothetical protein
MPPGGNNFWYAPSSTYGSGQNWYDTPFSSQFMSPQVPQGEYLAYLTNNNLGGFDRRSQFAQGLYGKSQQGYQAAALNNPTLSYRDYLNQHLGSVGGLFDTLTPEQRGEGGVARNFGGRARLYGRG